MNDPYSGGQHLPDVMTFTPVFSEGRIIAIAGTLGHQLDLGGTSAGSYYSKATEIFQEGLRIPPVKLYEEGVLNKAIAKIFESNIREPVKTMGDVNAQIAALQIGKNGVIRLAEKYGTETLVACMNTLMRNSERRTRAKIRELPDGVYSFEDWNDDDGITDTPIKIKVTITIKNDEMTIDFTGSNPQVAGPVNSPIGTTNSAAFYAAMCVIDPTIPPNYGCYVPIHVIAPKGTVTNPEWPAPVVGRMTVGHRIVDVVMGAMSQVAPESVMAAYYGMTSALFISGTDPKTGFWLSQDSEVGGWGARPGKDGPDAFSCGFHNLANTPMEMVEMLYPLQYVRYGLRTDTGGPGKYRGGLGLWRELKIRDNYDIDHINYTVQGERVKHAPFGIMGGKSGGRGLYSVIKNGVREVIPSKTSDYRIEKGDIISIGTQGGGGYGNPKERNPEMVLHDVKEGKVTLKSAEEDYYVSIDKTTMTINEEVTTRLRK